MPLLVLTRIVLMSIILVNDTLSVYREDGMTSGEKLRECRGMQTQAEVAKALNISRSALMMYENDKRTPRDPVKIELANYYGTTVSYLFFEH